MKVRFCWYDLWVGVYVDRRRRTIYICLLPTLVLVLHRHTYPGCACGKYTARGNPWEESHRG